MDRLIDSGLREGAAGGGGPGGHSEAGGERGTRSRHLRVVRRGTRTRPAARAGRRCGFLCARGREHGAVVPSRIPLVEAQPTPPPQGRAACVVAWPMPVLHQCSAGGWWGSVTLDVLLGWSNACGWAWAVGACRCWARSKKASRLQRCCGLPCGPWRPHASHPWARASLWR